MDADKLKQIVAFIGGVLGAVLLFLDSLDVSFAWFNQDSIDAFTNLLASLVPLILVGYGIYKNQYLLTEKAKKQENFPKGSGLK